MCIFLTCARRREAIHAPCMWQALVRVFCRMILQNYVFNGVSMLILEVKNEIYYVFYPLCIYYRVFHLYKNICVNMSFCRIFLQNRRFRCHFGQFEGQLRILHENLHLMYIIRLDPAIYVDYCADFVLLSQCRSATARIRRRNRNIPAPGVILEARFELSSIQYPFAYFFLEAVKKSAFL